MTSVLPLALVSLLLSSVSTSMAGPCDSDWATVDYKTVRFGNGAIYLFIGDKYYVFTPGNLRNAQEKRVSDSFPDVSNQITESFVQNGKIYYVFGEEAIVYDGHKLTRKPWNSVSRQIAHLLIRKNRQVKAFFAPPKANAGWGQSYSMMDDLELIALGGGSISTATVNRKFLISYNGYQIPEQFNAYLVNKEDASVTFFNGDKYATSSPSNWMSSDFEFDWKDTAEYFGCN